MSSLIHIYCPACGQAFLTHAEHTLSVQSCPHCAFTGTAGQFVTGDASTTAGLDIRRRQNVRRAAPAAMAAANPRAWEVRTYEPITPAPFIGPVGAVAAPPQREVPGMTPQWETMQAFATAPAMTSAPAPIEPVYPGYGEATPAAPRMAAWVPMKAPGDRKMTQWPSLNIAPPLPDDPGHFAPRRQRSFTGVFIVLVAVVLTGVVAALWLDKKNAARNNAGLRAKAEKSQQVRPALVPPPAVIASAIVRPTPKESLLGTDATVSLVGTLLKNLDTATTTEARMACLASEPRLKDSVEEFFKPLSSPLQFDQVRSLPAVVHAMPGKHPIALCAVQAVMPDGKINALARLIESSDGSLKLDWNTLHDSLTHRLATYSAEPRRDPQWITIGMLRNFGFDEPAATRERYFVFDIQGLGDGADHRVAFAAKDIPIGRSLDETLTWKQLYIVRALVHWTQVGDQQRLTILDAELTPEASASR